jgi:integrase
LPLIPSVLEQLKTLPRPIDSTVCLFPSETNKHKSYYHGFRKHWDKALEDTGISDFRFHDLRHSAASYLTEKGVPLVTVADILGHKTMAMVQRYSHVHTEQKKKVVTEVFKDLLG